LQGAPQGCQQFIVGDRLGKPSERTIGQCRGAQVLVLRGRYENDRQGRLVRSQSTLQFQTVQSGHPDIGDHARDFVDAGVGEQRGAILV
jgi:hypothetical protein